MTIEVNGFPETLPVGASVQEAIEHLSAQHKDLIVELNGRFVHVRDYPTTRLFEGARLELIHAAFGG